MIVDTNPPVPGRLSANLVCMGSMLIWAAGLPAAGLLIPLMTGAQLNALRMGLAALALLPVWALLEGFAPMRRVNWPRGIAVGSLIGLGAWFLIRGQMQGGAVTAAVISATLPVVGITLEVMLDGRKLTRALIVGLILALIGGSLALDLRSGSLSLGFGALLCFGSVLCFTIGSRLTVTAFPDQSPIGRTALTLTGAAVAAITVALVQIAMGTPLPDHALWGWHEFGAILLYAVGSMAISQVMWIMSVEKLGIGLSSLHINAAPFYVMLILFAFGATWDWSQAAAATLVGFGVLIAQGVLPLPKVMQ